MVTIGINGFGNWEKFTLPCIRSIEKEEPDYKGLVVVDNHSSPPYPSDSYARIIRTPQMSYAGMMNFVVRMYPAEWYLILNNDTICTAPPLHYFDTLDPMTMYGNRVLIDSKNRPFVETWIVAFSQKTYDLVGEWDENFRACAFEDADYGYRAEKVGVGIRKWNFPFYHLGGSRWDTPGYKRIREANYKYLVKKHGFVGEMREWNGWG